MSSVTAVLGLISAVVRAEWEKWRAPRLRLDSPYVRGEPGKHVLRIVPHGDRWQVAFGMSLRNDGGRDARNWRVRFVSFDADTVLYLDSQHDGRHVTGTLVGSGWQHEVRATNPSDTVPPGLPVNIHGSHTLNFRGQPDSIEMQCWVGAEGTPPHEDTLHLKLHWTNMTARFQWGRGQHPAPWLRVRPCRV